jgi:hypothetical protein
MQMNELLYAVIESFKTIVKWDVAKFALLSGIALMAVWFGVGFILWDPLVSFTASLLDFVPFALIKSNGAWMLSSVIFIQAIFISFAFIIIIFGIFIMEKSKVKKYPLYIITIAFCVILFWTVIWYINHATIHNSLARLLTWLPFETVEQSMAYLFAVYLLYSLFIVSLLLFVGIFSENILDTALGYSLKKVSEIKIITYTLKDGAIYLILSLLFFPLLFIPVLNFFIQIGVWMWLGKNTFSYDMGSVFYNKDNMSDMLKEHRFSIWMITFIASLFNLVPVLNIFGPYFGEFATYYYLEACKTSLQKES